MHKVEPTQLKYDPGGVPFSSSYGDVYASRDGALGQARHVFLGGNDLPRRWARRDQFVVLETGFGIGTNFLATWQAWRDDPDRPRCLHFVSVERHPLAGDDLRRAAPGPLRSLAAQLAEQWPLPLPGLHRLDFEGGRIVLTLALGDAADVVPQLVLGADAFFLDGFAPDRNPDMWSPPLLKALARVARPGATLATWCTARGVRDALAAGGFVVERRPGYGHKRDMLAARFEPRWKVRRHEPPLPRTEERRALIIGAGLAGCAAADALARRGWRVDVLDAGTEPATGASALPWGLLHPQVSRDDNVLARLTRAGFLLGRQRLGRLPASERGAVWHDCGVIQQARDDAEVLEMQRALRRVGMSSQFAQWLDAADASERAGITLHRGGLWFSGGGVVSARRWCRAMLESQREDITLRTAETAAGLAPCADGWRATDPGGRTLGTAPVVLVAAALAAPGLLGLRCAPVRPVRGRLSLLRAGDLAKLRVGLAGEGYAIRGRDGTVGVGASYEIPPADAGGACYAPDEDIHRGNLQRLARLFVDPVAVAVSGMFDGMRCVANDRLPFAGPVADEAGALANQQVLRGAHLAELPRRRGLCASFAFGSRGLTLASLAAELIAAQLEGEPWPIERNLAAAIDPARVLLRRLRSTRPSAEPPFAA